MSALELVVGGLLLTSGFMGAFGFLWDEVDHGVHMEGAALFPDASYEGDAWVHATDAAFLERGNYDVWGHAGVVKVTVYTYDIREGTVVAGIPTTGGGYAFAGSHQSTEAAEGRFLDAEIRIEGDESGVFNLWPMGETSGASFEVNLSEERVPTVFPSPTGAAFYSKAGGYERNMEGPLFGLGHGVERYQSAYLGDAAFAHMAASGGLVAVVENGTLEIAHEDGVEVYELDSRPGEKQRVGAGSSWASYEHDAEGSFAVVEVPGASQGFLRSEAVGKEAVFLAQEPEWHINGTVTFTAEKGDLIAGDKRHPLVDDKVEVGGNISLDLAAIGEDDLSGGLHKGWRLPPALLEEPRVDAAFDGDAEAVRVNGEAITPPPVVELREEVTLVGKILGALLFLWSIGRRLLFFAVGLVSKDPLDHERRRVIYDMLEEQGMAYMREIQRETEIPLGSLSYHLRVLKDAGIVQEVKEAGYSVYFPVSSRLSMEEMERLALLANGTRRKIAEAIVRSEAVSQQDIAECLGKSQNWVSRLLEELEEARLVERRGDWRIRYQATGLLERWFSTR